jgi:hypothetical protein
MEMQSAAREPLKITTVVMGTVRWDLAASGLGCEGFYVEKTEDRAGADARSAKEPGGACVKTNRDAVPSLFDGRVRLQRLVGSMISRPDAGSSHERVRSGGSVRRKSTQ